MLQTVAEELRRIELESHDLFPDWPNQGVVTLRLTPSGEAKLREAKRIRSALVVEIDPEMFMTSQAMRSGGGPQERS